MDSLKNVQKTWDKFAHERPHWSVLTTSSEEQGASFYQSGRADVESVLQQVESVGPLNSTTKALDFGCGLGRLTYPLCERFEEVTAVDISAKMIELASSHELCPSNATFHAISDSDLRFLSDESFDFVLSLIVLQHIPKRFIKRYLQEFARVAKPGGTIVFQIPTLKEKSKQEHWKDKPLLSDNPAFHTLCYRIALRALRRTKRTLLSDETLHRLDCAWKKATGKEIMQMNTLKENVLRKLLAKQSCEVIDAIDDGRAGEGYTSKLFIVKKTVR